MEKDPLMGLHSHLLAYCRLKKEPSNGKGPSGGKRLSALETLQSASAVPYRLRMAGKRWGWRGGGAGQTVVSQVRGQSNLSN